MQVETYEVNEVTAEGADALDGEAVALIERMGLTGQQSLVSRGPGDAAVLPYQAMTAEEVAVYELLFPAKALLKEYREGPIPLRVLQAAALASERDWFTRLEVWHKRSGSAKEDPLLVGIIGGTHSWEVRNRFLLARWGDALAPYAEQLRQAAAIARDRLLNAAAKARAEIDGGISLLANVSDVAAVRWCARGGPMTTHNEPPADA